MALLDEIGYRLICKACFNPFRCFRVDETHCGWCRDLKDQQMPENRKIASAEDLKRMDELVAHLKQNPDKIRHFETLISNFLSQWDWHKW